MSKSIFKKAAAMVCTAATAAVLGVAAIPASAAVTAPTNVVTPVSASYPSEGSAGYTGNQLFFEVQQVQITLDDAKSGNYIPVRYRVQNNTIGFSAIGSGLHADATDLQILTDKDNGGTADSSSCFTKNALFNNLTGEPGANNSAIGNTLCVASNTMMGTALNKNSDWIIEFYYYFTDEEKANLAVGNKYPIKMSIDSILDENSRDITDIANPVGRLQYDDMFNGYIEIVDAGTTSSSTTETTTSTSTTETTSTTKKTETTSSTSETTTSSTKKTDTTSSTTETTSSTKKTDTTTSTTNSTSASSSNKDTNSTSKNTGTTKGSTASTAKATTAKGTTATTAAAAKTGDAGVGLAVVALLTAAGTAVVATSKKKED